MNNSNNNKDIKMENNVENIFEDPQCDQGIPILLIDSSGSVMREFNTDHKTIFEKMESVINNIPAEKFRMIFWNSNNVENTAFAGGIIKLPHIVEKKYLKQPMFLARSKIIQTCLTFPHIGFESIDPTWINNVDPTHIYLLTDGQMGYNTCSSNDLLNLKNKLATNIENIFKTYNNVHLHIVSVEAEKRNYDNYETVCNAAGGDVYIVVQNHGLTKYVTEFTSYSLNNVDGFKHINTVIPPVGFVPYESKYFSQTKIPQFLGWLQHQIQKDAQNEIMLLKIIQNLSKTAAYMVKDKNEQMTINILTTLCLMFMETCLDISMVKFMLADTVALEREGKSIVLSEYKLKLQNLYKEAQNLLQKNASNAMNIGYKFVTLPINGKIIAGPSALVSYFYKVKKQSYNKAAIKLGVGNKFVPVLPFELDRTSPLNEQCIRQFIRSTIFLTNCGKINFMDDIVIYVVMGLMLQVVMSDMPISVKTCYRNLATIMLGKKYNNSQISILDRIKTGELPTPNNGKLESFYGYMEKVKSMTNLTNISPLSMWYILCLALDNNSVITKQLLHCVESLEKDFGSSQDYLINIKDRIRKIDYVEIPLTQTYNYQCIVTAENVENIGGYVIKPHQTVSGHACMPNYVVSDNGYNQMTNNTLCFCPCCYNLLTIASFEKVGPKVLDGQFDNL